MNNLLNQIEIKYLADVPELVPTIAKWSYDTWGKYDPNLSVESEVKSFGEKLNKDKVPMAFVALNNNQPIATVNLKKGIPVQGYEDRDLWLGCFIVADEYKNLGIGTHLLEHAFNEAKKLGYSKISLFTSNPESAKWYAMHGWKQFATDVYQGHPVTLFERNLAGPKQTLRP